MECSTIKSHWKGSFTVVLSTPTAVKVPEIIPWIQYSQVKPASLEWECISDSVYPHKITFRTLAPFPDRTLLPSRQQETMDNETSALL
jgi:hypothetical protein